jgi:hypothetical protein
MKRKGGRNWIALSLSAGLHLLLLALSLRLSRETPDSVTEPDRVSEQRRDVSMIYIPPQAPTPKLPRVRPEPAPRRVPLPAPTPRREPEPEPNAPPEARRSSGSEPDEPTPPAAPPASRPAPAAVPRQNISALESEARRIFGLPHAQTPPGAGPQAIRPMEAYAPDHPEQCIAHPAPAESIAPQFGTVVGRIYRQDNGRPLAGAHLQMLGAPYVAFTDATGEYRFRFDLSLVDNCRTQYVRVTAAGYESRLLVLTVGPNARSEDVLLRRQ